MRRWRRSVAASAPLKARERTPARSAPLPAFRMAPIDGSRRRPAFRRSTLLRVCPVPSLLRAPTRGAAGQSSDRGCTRRGSPSALSSRRPATAIAIAQSDASSLSAGNNGLRFRVACRHRFVLVRRLSCDAQCDLIEKLADKRRASELRRNLRT